MAWRSATSLERARDSAAASRWRNACRATRASSRSSCKLNLREGERRGAYQNLVVDQTNAGVRVQNVGILQRAANGLLFGVENVIVIWL